MYLVAKGAAFEYPKRVEEERDVLPMEELRLTLSQGRKQGGECERD